MAEKKVKRYSASFKAKVALEAIKGDATIGEVASRFGVHPTQVQLWKAAILKNAEAVFSKPGNQTDDSDKHVAQLERKVGQLTIENDFLKKNYTAYQKKSGL
jgi:transposase-like protein